MRKALLGVLLAASMAAAHASGTATVTCGQPGQTGQQQSYFGYGWGGTPIINVTYSTGGDGGQPGVFWLGILTPDQQVADALNINQQWIQYTGGLYPPNQVFTSGMPGTVTVSIPLPGDPSDTSQYVGYTIYAGHGVLTTQDQQEVAYRRQYLNANEARMQQNGTWNSAYADDSQFEWALVQKDMLDNNKWGAVITIPYVNCDPFGN